MLQTTNKFAGDESCNNQTRQNEVTYDLLGGAVDANGGDGVGRRIENLLTVTKLAKSKKSNLVKFKKSDLAKSKKSNLSNDFTKANSTRKSFFTFEAKKTFIHLQKSFTKAPILRHFDLECYIRIKTDVSGYTISGVLSQMTLNQLFSNHVFHKNLDLITSKSEIGQ